MDAVHNSVVYIDARAREAREFTRNSPPQTKSAVEGIPPSELLSTLTPGEEANENIHCLLRTFSRGMSISLAIDTTAVLQQV